MQLNPIFYILSCQNQATVALTLNIPYSETSKKEVVGRKLIVEY